MPIESLANDSKFFLLDFLFTTGIVAFKPQNIVVRREMNALTVKVNAVEAFEMKNEDFTRYYIDEENGMFFVYLLPRLFARNHS